MDTYTVLCCMVNNISFQGVLIDYGIFTLLCHRLCALTDIKLIHYCNGSCINNITLIHMFVYILTVLSYTYNFSTIMLVLDMRQTCVTLVAFSL